MAHSNTDLDLQRGFYSFAGIPGHEFLTEVVAADIGSLVEVFRAFQQFFTLPERNLHIVPPGIGTERAVFTEPLAAACEILDRVSIPGGERVAVLGDGKLGLLIAMVLNANGYRVRLFGRYAEKLRIAATGVETSVGLPPPVAEYDWAVVHAAARFESAIPLLAHPGIRLEEMVAARYPFREAPAAFARAAERGTLKVLLYAD